MWSAVANTNVTEISVLVFAQVATDQNNAIANQGCVSVAHPPVLDLIVMSVHS